ncbi:MAG TPA: hypothetical protein VN665_00980 [Candidatus Paceibacterota bacterium]|nr:hypothetical protein [Candidatus Paceibacterota bacterium]
MVILISIIVVLVVIGVVVVVRSGEREVDLDERDHQLPNASEQFQMLPTITAEVAEDASEELDSWTLDSVEETPTDSESE